MCASEVDIRGIGASYLPLGHRLTNDPSATPVRLRNKPLLVGMRGSIRSIGGPGLAEDVARVANVPGGVRRGCKRSESRLRCHRTRVHDDAGWFCELDGKVDGIRG